MNEYALIFVLMLLLMCVMFCAMAGCVVLGYWLRGKTQTVTAPAQPDEKRTEEETARKREQEEFQNAFSELMHYNINTVYGLDNTET